MPRDDLSEHRIQATLIGLLRHKLRGNVVCMAIPNGGARHPIVGRMLKAEGLVPGSPDLVFALERSKVFWLEMKRGDGRLSDEQIGMHHRLRANGHDVAVAYTLDQALSLLEQRGVLK